MKTFSYVIAPEGCESYLTPGKKYDISIISPITNKFRLKDNNGDLRFSTCLSRLHTNDNWWIIPEIGQWPDGWTRHQKAKCLQKAGVEILITGAFMQIIGEEQSYEGETSSFSSNDFQGRTQQQVEGSYQIASLCFVAIIIIVILAVLFV